MECGWVEGVPGRCVLGQLKPSSSFYPGRPGEGTGPLLALGTGIPVGHCAQAKDPTSEPNGLVALGRRRGGRPALLGADLLAEPAAHTCPSTWWTRGVCLLPCSLLSLQTTAQKCSLPGPPPPATTTVGNASDPKPCEVQLLEEPPSPKIKLGSSFHSPDLGQSCNGWAGGQLEPPAHGSKSGLMGRQGWQYGCWHRAPSPHVESPLHVTHLARFPSCPGPRLSFLLGHVTTPRWCPGEGVY